MRKYFLLLKMLFYGLFGINKAIHSKDPKQRQQIITFGSAYAVLIIFAASFSWTTAIGLAQTGLTDSIPAIMLLYCAVITLVLTFFESNGVIFGLKDYDQIMSLPIKSSQMILSRVSFVYLINFGLSLIIMLPAAIVYGLTVGAPVSVYLMLLSAPVFIPLVPMAAALAVGAMITAIAVRFKYKNVVTIILSFAVTLGILAWSFSFRGTQEDLAALENIAMTVGDAVNDLYFLAALLSKSVADNDALSFLSFAAISAAAMIIFTVVLNVFYTKINTAIFSIYRKNDYRVSELKTASPFMALYKKELRRFFTCTIYILNQGFGSALFVMAGVGLLIAGPAAMLESMELGGALDGFMHSIPFVMALIVAMTSTTCVALSLEGKYRWIMCSVPVGAKTVFDSKILVHLTFFLPASVIGGVLWVIAFMPSPAIAALMLITPVVYTFFIAVAGMYFNMRFPKYDWASEYYCVKGGSASLFITLAAGFGTTLVPMIISFVIPAYGTAFLILILIAISSATLALYNKLSDVRLYA